MTNEGLKSFNGLNVSGLLNRPTLNQVNEIDLDKVHEDANNARKEFDESSLDELAKSINSHGVVSPISLRKHDTIDGHFIINHGHRRYRASLKCGKKTIPAFLDDRINTFGRFIENLQREDLSPIDIANQLKNYQDQGYSNQEIAEEIGKSDSWVSRHLSVLDAPVPVKTAIDEGRIKSVEAAAALTNLHEDYPDQVEDFLNESEDVSQKKVRELSKDLKSNKPKKSSPKNTKKDVTVDELLDDDLKEKDSDSDDFQNIDSDSDNAADDEAGEDSEPKLKKPSSPLIDLFKEIKLSELQVQYLVDELQDTNKYDSSFDKLREYFSNN